MKRTTSTMFQWYLEDGSHLDVSTNEATASLIDATFKDAERFRWLLANRVVENENGEDRGDKSIVFHCDFENHNDVRAAIDDAMEIQKHIGKLAGLVKNIIRSNRS